MITSITNIIITRLMDDLDNINIELEYPSTSAELPCVVVEEGNLTADITTFDSGGYHHTNYTITMDIYTDGTGRVGKAHKIRNDIDSILSGEYRLQRIFSDSIPNMGDLNVYRYRVTYIAKLDKNKTIFRG